VASSVNSAWASLAAQAHAWQLNPDNISPFALRESCLVWLAPNERRRFEKFKTAALRHDYLAAQALCRATLSRYAAVKPRDWRFVRGSHGKPRIETPSAFRSLHFNLTHTKGLAICLVSRIGEVGVDAEETSARADIPRLSELFMSQRERRCLAAVAANRRADRFFEYWVIKEAYLKGIRRGITGAPQRLTIEFDNRGRPKPVRNWQLFLRRVDATHVAAAAVKTANPSVSVRWLWARLPL
jgi:4'-phosphopantetheinyl transferase